MRVLFWSELFQPYIGGAEIVGARLLPALRARGHEFLVVTSHDYLALPDEALFEGIPVYRFPFRPALAKGNIVQLVKTRQQVARLKQTFAPDLIHFNSLGPSVFFHLETANAHTAPLLVTLTNMLQKPTMAQESLQRLLRAATWVTGKATAVITQARQLVPEITPRSSVIPNGIDLPPFLPDSLPVKPPRLLCLGRLTLQKGFDLALTALASIVARYPHVRLTIAGDGLERSALERQVSALGLSQIVDFTGWIAPDKVFTLINTATIVLMPSRWEGFPSVALQAALMARPVVATRVGGLPEIVEHQQTGQLVENEDSAGLAEAIIFLLEHPEVATRLGQAARQRVQENFSWEQCVNAYDTLYQKLLTEDCAVDLSHRT